MYVVPHAQSIPVLRHDNVAVRHPLDVGAVAQEGTPRLRSKVVPVEYHGTPEYETQGTVLVTVKIEDSTGCVLNASKMDIGTQFLLFEDSISGCTALAFTLYRFKSPSFYGYNQQSRRKEHGADTGYSISDGSSETGP